MLTSDEPWLIMEMLTPARESAAAAEAAPGPVGENAIDGIVDGIHEGVDQGDQTELLQRDGAELIHIESDGIGLEHIDGDGCAEHAEGIAQGRCLFQGHGISSFSAEAVISWD